MYTDVYADVLFLINFSMDTIALYITARLCALKIRALRLVLAAIIGALYSVVGLFLDLVPLIEVAVVILVCVVMTCVAYSGSSLKVILKHSCVMFVSSSLLGGVMSAFYSIIDGFIGEYAGAEAQQSIDPLLFCVIACVSMAAGLFLTRLHGSGNMPDKVEVRIIIFGKEIHTEGIVDTGNLLTDPLSGKFVILISRDLLHGILSSEFLRGAASADMVSPYNLPPEEMSRFRLIPAQGVGERMYLYGVCADKIKLEYQKGKKNISAEKDALVGIAPNLGKDTACIVPSAII